MLKNGIYLIAFVVVFRSCASDRVSLHNFFLIKFELFLFYKVVHLVTKVNRNVGLSSAFSQVLV